MKDVDYLLESMGETAAYLKEYIEHRIKLAKLEAAERGAVIISEAITALVFVVLGSFVFILANLTIVFFLAKAINSLPLSFLILTIFYSLIGVALFSFRHRLITDHVVKILLMKMFTADVNENVEDIKEASNVKENNYKIMEKEGVYIDN